MAEKTRSGAGGHAGGCSDRKAGGLFLRAGTQGSRAVSPRGVCAVDTLAHVPACARPVRYRLRGRTGLGGKAARTGDPEQDRGRGRDPPNPVARDYRPVARGSPNPRNRKLPPPASPIHGAPPQPPPPPPGGGESTAVQRWRRARKFSGPLCGPGGCWTPPVLG